MARTARRRASRPSRASARARSGRRRRSPRPSIPCSRIRRWKPRFVIDVTTTRSPASAWRPWRSIASAAMMASPFTGRPRRSTARQRSASPSNAMPQSASAASTAAATAPRCVEPTRSLMFRPSGSAPMNAGVEVHALGEPAGGGRGGPVRAVEHHQAIALHALAVRLEQPVGVALDGVLDRLDAAAARARGRAHRRLDVGLGGVGQLAPVRAEELDAVVGVRVVRGRDDAAQVGAELAHQDRDAGSRDDPGRERGASAGDDAVDEGGLERRARLAGVSAQHDPATRAGDGGRRRPQLAGEVLGQIDAGDPPHAVCPEQLAERCQRLGISASRTAAACGPSSGRPSCARPGGRRGSGTPASSGRCAGSRRPR